MLTNTFGRSDARAIASISDWIARGARDIDYGIDHIGRESTSATVAARE